MGPRNKRTNVDVEAEFVDNSSFKRGAKDEANFTFTRLTERSPTAAPYSPATSPFSSLGGRALGLLRPPGRRSRRPTGSPPPASPRRTTWPPIPAPPSCETAATPSMPPSPPTSSWASSPRTAAGSAATASPSSGTAGSRGTTAPAGRRLQPPLTPWLAHHRPDMPQFGPLPITVPGAVDAWFALLERYGTRSFAELAGPAIAYASDGFPLTTAGAARIQAGRPADAGWGEWEAIYGRAAAGTRLAQPALARTLETVARRRARCVLPGGDRGGGGRACPEARRPARCRRSRRSTRESGWSRWRAGIAI